MEGLPCVFYQNETVISWSRSFLQKFGASEFQLTTTFATFVEGVACDGFSPQWRSMTHVKVQENTQAWRESWHVEVQENPQ